MVDYPTPGVKKAAIVAVGNMCTCVHKANTESTSVETTTGKYRSFCCKKKFEDT